MRHAAVLALAICACAPRAKPAPAPGAVVVDVAADGTMSVAGRELAEAKAMPAGTELRISMRPDPAATKQLQFLLREASVRGWPVAAIVTSREKPLEGTLDAMMSAEGHVSLAGKSAKPQLAGELVTEDVCRDRAIRLTGTNVPEISATLAVGALAKAGCDVVLSVSR